MIGKYFLPDCGLIFHLHNIAFQRSEVLNIDQVQFINFHFLDHVFGVKYPKSLPNSKSRILPVFFPLQLQLSRLGLWPTPSSWCALWKVQTSCVGLTFLHIKVPLFQHHLLNDLSFPRRLALADILLLNCQVVSISRWHVCGSISGFPLLSHWHKICSFSDSALYRSLCVYTDIWDQVVWVLLLRSSFSKPT